MLRRLSKTEKEQIRKFFSLHPLYEACSTVVTPRIANFDGVDIGIEEVFYAVAKLLDYMYCANDLKQQAMERLWHEFFLDIRQLKSDASKHDKQLLAHTVFAIVRNLFCYHWEMRYCETLYELLTQTIEKETKGCNSEELLEFQKGLTEFSEIFDEWINHCYDGGLSEEIDKIIVSSSNSQAFIPNGQTFSKTALLTDTLIDIIGQRLSQANKLDASPDDFRKLFSGVDQQFTMIWLGTGGELRDLFKMLTNDGYAKPKRGYQPILKSHFLDEYGHRFNNLHGDKSIESFQTIIDDCSFLLQHLTESMTDIMKRLINDNKPALRELGYFEKLQLAKQSGLSIKNKRR